MLTGSSTSASVELASKVDSGASLGGESSLLSALPADSWVAAAVPNLGVTLWSALDQLSSSGLPGAGSVERQVQAQTGLHLGDDVFHWLGDAAGFVAGTTPSTFTAGLIAQTSDPQGPRRLLASARANRRAPVRDAVVGPAEGRDVRLSRRDRRATRPPKRG